MLLIPQADDPLFRYKPKYFLLHMSVALHKGIPWPRKQTWPSQEAGSQPATEKST